LWVLSSHFIATTEHRVVTIVGLLASVQASLVVLLPEHVSQLRIFITRS